MDPWLRRSSADVLEIVKSECRPPRRGSAEKLLGLDAGHTTGAVVVTVKEPFTTTQAATMLVVSRATLVKLVESSELDHMKVGTHHRDPAQAILEF